MPEYNDKDALSTWIDKNISADYPDVNEASTEEDIKYSEMVESYMIHRCSSGTVNSCLDSNGQCSKHYTSNKRQKTSKN